jgi:hypothetical protein
MEAVSTSETAVNIPPDYNAQYPRRHSFLQHFSILKTNWLITFRKLTGLAVRSEKCTELINTLSEPPTHSYGVTDCENGRYI